MRKIYLAALMALPGVAGAPAQGGQYEGLAKEIHAAVIERVPEYRILQGMKVLVGCFEWARSTEPPFKLHQIFASHTGIGSDGQIFPGVLRRNAMHDCKGWAAKEQAPCECQVLDESGKNVLKVPDGAILWIPPQQQGGIGTMKRFSD